MTVDVFFEKLSKFDCLHTNFLNFINEEISTISNHNILKFEVIDLGNGFITVEIKTNKYYYVMHDRYGKYDINKISLLTVKFLDS